MKKIFILIILSSQFALSNEIPLAIASLLQPGQQQAVYTGSEISEENQWLDPVQIKSTTGNACEVRVLKTTAGDFIMTATVISNSVPVRSTQFFISQKFYLDDYQNRKDQEVIRTHAITLLDKSQISRNEKLPSRTSLDMSKNYLMGQRMISIQQATLDNRLIFQNQKPIICLFN